MLPELLRARRPRGLASKSSWCIRSAPAATQGEPRAAERRHAGPHIEAQPVRHTELPAAAHKVSRRAPEPVAPGALRTLP